MTESLEAKLRKPDAAGEPVRLANGEEWLVPAAIVRVSPNLRLDESGKVVSEAVSVRAETGQLAEIFERAEREGATLPWADVFVAAYLILKKNYPELTPEQANGLLGPEEAGNVVDVYNLSKKNELGTIGGAQV